MDRYSDVVQNENGRAVPGASILIVGANGQPAVIFSDRQGTALVNPFITDPLGRWSFCAADGVYSARVSFNGVLKTTVRDIRLEDPDDGFASLAKTTGAGLIGMLDGRSVQVAFSALSTTVAGLTNYTLPKASASTLGGIRIGTGLAIDASGIVSLTYSYTLPTASNTVLGGVKVGAGLAIDAGGVLSATGVTQGSVSSVNGVSPNGSGAVTLVTDNLAEDASPINLWFTGQRVLDAGLTGLSVVTNAAITAADTVLSAAGKLQAQVSALVTSLSGKQDVSGKGAVSGYAGLDANRSLVLPNSAGSFSTTITNAATAARSIALPNKAGTVALLDDIVAGSLGRVLLASTTLASATGPLSWLNIFTSEYDTYEVEMRNYSAIANDILSIRIAAAGAVITGNAYTPVSTYSGTVQNMALTGLWSVSPGQAANNPGHLDLRIILPSATSGNTQLLALGGYRGPSNEYIHVGGYAWMFPGAAPSGIQLFWANGSAFSVGTTVRIYGRKKA